MSNSWSRKWKHNPCFLFGIQSQRISHKYTQIFSSVTHLWCKGAANITASESWLAGSLFRGWWERKSRMMHTSASLHIILDSQTPASDKLIKAGKHSCWQPQTLYHSPVWYKPRRESCLHQWLPKWMLWVGGCQGAFYTIQSHFSTKTRLHLLDNLRFQAKTQNKNNNHKYPKL